MPTYDWNEIQKYHNAGHGMRECQRHFGFSAQTWQKAKERGAIISRGYPKPLPLEKLQNRSSVRNRVLRNDLLPYKCSMCGIKEWRGIKLSLNLDHINGNGDDHRLENLRWVCPNCDSQLSTYGGRNVKR